MNLQFPAAVKMPAKRPRWAQSQTPWRVLAFSWMRVVAALFLLSEIGHASPEKTDSMLLPSGWLSVRGAKIVGSHGTPVRIASVGVSGMNVIGGRLELEGPFHGLEGHVAAMKSMGFNCVRVDWIDKTLQDSGAMAQLDAFVAACRKAGLKVIFDNHNNEATSADWANAAQQKNGLWFDAGPGTDGTDGAGNKGTISAAKFEQDWVTFARHWAGNSTVIGFDIRNEPCAHTSTPALWGGHGPTDIRSMYQAVGDAILGVNPDVLIICEAVIDYRAGAYEGDLSCVRDRPVKLSNPAKLVYSVHEYPKEIGGYRGPESGSGYIERMNRTWGWLMAEDVAPVWIGEMGASMKSASSREWGATLLDYMNGRAKGGLVLTPDQPGVSGDWWAWGCLEGQNPDGCVAKDGKLRPEQAVFIQQMLFYPTSVRAALEPLVRLRLEPGTVLHSISSDFIGFGYEKSAVAQEGLFTATNAHLVQLYRTLSPHGLVRIGGNVSDHTRFVPEGKRLVRTEKETSIINRTSLEEFAAFLRATGWKAMWGFNLGTGTKEEAAQEALAVQEALGDRLQSFEIGNEVDLLRRFHGFEAYYAAYREYKAAVRKVVPEAVFSGPDVAGNMQWLLDFARREAGDVKLLTHHYYRSGASRPNATIETLLAPDSKWEEKLAELQQASRDSGVPFRINEVNSFYGGGKAGVSDTFASALWCLDYMFGVAAHGGNGVNMETDVNQLGWISHYSPIYRNADGQLTARPELYGMLAFALAARGDLLKVTSSGADMNLSAYATRTPEGKFWVTVINQELERGAQVRIVLPKNCSSAQAYRLEAPAIESRQHVTLGGVEVKPNGVWSPDLPQKLAVQLGVASLKLPATSAALVELR